jgi:hypothetical protein
MFFYSKVNGQHSLIICAFGRLRICPKKRRLIANTYDHKEQSERFCFKYVQTGSLTIKMGVKPLLTTTYPGAPFKIDFNRFGKIQEDQRLNLTEIKKCIILLYLFLPHGWEGLAISFSGFPCGTRTSGPCYENGVERKNCLI